MIAVQLRDQSFLVSGTVLAVQLVRSRLAFGLMGAGNCREFDSAGSTFQQRTIGSSGIARPIRGSSLSSRQICFQRCLASFGSDPIGQSMTDVWRLKGLSSRSARSLTSMSD